MRYHFGLTVSSRAGTEVGVGIAGTGRVAQALGRLLLEKGVPVLAVGGRNEEHARGAACFIGGRCEPVRLEELPARVERVLIAVKDDAVHQVAALLARAGMREGIALHTCGAFGPEVLGPLAEAGVACGCLHPLQTLANPEQALNSLQGAIYAIDGDPRAVRWAEEIVERVSGKAVRVPPEARGLYHAAAVLASNYVVALLDAAGILLGAAGFESGLIRQALAPLVEASVFNALRDGPESALTGPIRRGDVETVRGHLKALESMPRPLQELYRAAGLQTLELARRAGLEQDKARELEAVLRGQEGEHER